MRAQSGYKTRQRFVIEEFLKNNADRHITADEICSMLPLVSRSTVYRCLERLQSEGRVRKYVAESGESACYQYVSDDSCKENFHLRCEKCQKLIHIECEHLDGLARHILDEHGFKINPLKTVLYGVCEDCLKK